MVLKSILHRQKTEKIAFKVRPKKGKKLQKVIFLKSIFWPLGPLGGQKKIYHMKFKSKKSYVGKKISILPWQMAEQLAVEVDVKKRGYIMNKYKSDSAKIWIIVYLR